MNKKTFYNIFWKINKLIITPLMHGFLIKEIINKIMYQRLPVIL